MILIAIGANLPGRQNEAPIVTVRAATEALRSLPGLRLHSISRLYNSAPIPASDQPHYVNGVARLEGDADPLWLLRRLQSIERAAGRFRGEANAPRTLDLDIVAMGDSVREAPDPVLPHPRASERGFVLLPLSDVAPGWIHPVLGRTVEQLIAALPPQRIDRV